MGEFAGSYDRAHVAGLYDHIYDLTSRNDAGFYVNLAMQTGGPVLELGA